jgi:hypothetical protein
MPLLRSRPMWLILSQSASGSRYFVRRRCLRIAVLEGQVSSPTLHNPRSNLERLAAGHTRSQGELNLVAEPIVIRQMTPR